MLHVPLKTMYYPKIGMCCVLFQKTIVRTIHTKMIANVNSRKRTMLFMLLLAWNPEQGFGTETNIRKRIKEMIGETMWGEYRE